MLSSSQSPGFSEVAAADSVHREAKHTLFGKCRSKAALGEYVNT